MGSDFRSDSVLFNLEIVLSLPRLFLVFVERGCEKYIETVVGILRLESIEIGTDFQGRLNSRPIQMESISLSVSANPFRGGQSLQVVEHANTP